MPTTHQQLKILRTGTFEQRFRKSWAGPALPVWPLARRYTAWRASVCHCPRTMAILSVNGLATQQGKTIMWFIPLVIIEIALPSAFSKVYNGPCIFIFSIVAFGFLLVPILAVSGVRRYLILLRDGLLRTSQPPPRVRNVPTAARAASARVLSTSLRATRSCLSASKTSVSVIAPAL
jgi:hypothetical protein